MVEKNEITRENQKKQGELIYRLAQKIVLELTSPYHHTDDIIHFLATRDPPNATAFSTCSFSECVGVYHDSDEATAAVQQKFMIQNMKFTNKYAYFKMPLSLNFLPCTQNH
ncbi:hypothetical protein CEXT_41241 [Caerostris extrusa]|uniref:Uncharacterized protein n=1 Tax=Caerostris extrusa TaxID=172846 RepID=A0AAV4S009_CAEEX|nr:hypothetical protein CEXT_41241 [Caerostris extrusa]